ncbi:hypothetical protein ATKI12_2172 [Kitasatospora sp. Ki12]
MCRTAGTGSGVRVRCAPPAAVTRTPDVRSYGLTGRHRHRHSY